MTGTLWSGELHAGQEVRLQPGELSARVRSVQVHDRAVDRAAPGQRVALNLAGVGREEVQRGDVVTDEHHAHARRSWSMRSCGWTVAPSALRRGTRVQVHHGTRETPARVVPLEGETLEPGVQAFAQLRLERPVVPARGDHFVIRRVAPPDTIGGGWVVDARPRRHGPGVEHAKRLTRPRERRPARAARGRAG